MSHNSLIFQVFSPRYDFIFAYTFGIWTRKKHNSLLHWKFSLLSPQQKCAGNKRNKTSILSTLFCIKKHQNRFSSLRERVLWSCVVGFKKVPKTKIHTHHAYMVVSVRYYCVHKCWTIFVNNSDLNIPGSLNNSDLNIPASLNNSDVNIPASLNNSDSWIWIKHEFEFEQTTTRNKKFVQLSETSLNNSAKQVWIIQWSGFE